MAIRSVGYLRRSTERQEKSLDDQRAEIEKYAAENGYEIIEWYTDDGISGDDTERRSGFKQMHTAGCKGQFEAILVWDQDRFGRFDSIEAGHWVHPLRQAKVQLVTVTDGPVNWGSFTDRVMYSLKQEGKHQFLRDLSKNTVRSQISNALKGHLCGQAAPYGYDRILITADGEKGDRIRNGEDVSRPRSCHVGLVPSEDAEKVETARWLFEQYANNDIGIRSLANDLNSRGVPSPRGGKWSVSTIRSILQNRCYIGDFEWGKRRMGKYNRAAGSEIKERSDQGVHANPDNERILCENTHEALISREIWDQVQKKLPQRKTRTSSHKNSNGDAYLLTGMMCCGHCGNKMHGNRGSRQKKSRRYVYHKYICGSYQRHGTGSGCGHHAIAQDDMVQFLIRILQEAVLGGGYREELKAKVLEVLQRREKSDPKKVARLQRKLVELDRKLGQGAKRLLEVPDTVVALVAKELEDLKKQHDRTAKDLADLRAKEPTENLEELADQITGRLWNLGEELTEAEKRHIYPLSHGHIELRPDPVLSRLVNREFRSPVELFLSSVASWEPHIARLVLAA